MRISLLFLLILPLIGCALPTDFQMYHLHGEGKPEQAVSLFDQELTLESSNAETLLPLCNSLSVRNEFGRFWECLNAYEEKTDSDQDTSLVETYRAGMYFTLGNIVKAKQWAERSIENDKNPLPLGPYEWLARIAAKQGKRDEALVWIEKLDKLEATMFGISIGRDSIGALKREQKTRIYLDLNEPELAEQALRTPIPGKSMGEYIFMGVVDFFKTGADKVADKVANWVATQGSENWRFMNEVNALWVYGQVAYAKQDYRDSIQSFSRLLFMPNIENIRVFYIEGLYYLTRSYQAYGDTEKAAHFAAKLEQAVAKDAKNIPWPEERESFKRKYHIEGLGNQALKPSGDPALNVAEIYWPDPNGTYLTRFELQIPSPLMGEG